MTEYIYPRSPAEIAQANASSAVPGVQRFDGGNHLKWTYDFEDATDINHDGIEELTENPEYKTTINQALNDRETNEGIKREAIEGSIMPIFDCDKGEFGL